MKRKRKKSPLKKLKDDVWDLVSLYVRLKYADSAGYVQCYTCGKIRHYKDHIHAGHGFSGRGNAILYELDIIRPQCYGCNCCQSGKLDVFTYKLRTELGDERFEELWRLKNTIRKYRLYELEEMVIHYAKLVRKENKKREP